jgi:hypothetical protein
MTVTAPTVQKTADTTLTREWTTFRILFRRIVNGTLNRIFALTIKGSRQRCIALIVLFLLAGPLIGLQVFPWPQWRVYIQNLFSAILTNPTAIGDTFYAFINFAFAALTDARTVRFVPVLTLPFFLSLHLASIYLSDIFDLNDVSIARKFISEVSLGGADNTLTISAAEIQNKADEIEKSPISQIGGPGRVTVELDTAILVEKPDGRWRVIGPTHTDEDDNEEDEEEKSDLDEFGQVHPQKFDSSHHKTERHGHFPPMLGKSRKRKNKAVLEGFERIREMIDLRDQIPDALEINARSKDGIPISISDVRVVFSIFRDKKAPTTAEPHPFKEAAIQALVYNDIHQVIEGTIIHQKWYRSAGEPIWLTAMKSLLRRDLSLFMGKRNLGEYLASIGKPETQAVDELQENILNEKRELSGPDEEINRADAPPVPSFTARPKLSGLFNEFSEKFNEDQQKRGVQAQWVGVGTWKMPHGIPSQVIPEKHLEAWRITLENIGRGSDRALRDLEENSRQIQLQRLVQQTPIGIHHRNQEEERKPGLARRAILQAYRQQLIEASDNVFKTRRRIPPSIIVAFFYLTRQIQHMPYPAPPVPATPREARLYAALLARVRMSEAIERLVQLESEFSPGADRADLLERIIDFWDRDMR